MQTLQTVMIKEKDIEGESAVINSLNKEGGTGIKA
jgi:hypothetical protein